MESKQIKIGRVIPMFYSSIKNKLNSSLSLKKSFTERSLTPSHVTGNFNSLFETSDKSQMQIFRSKLNSLHFLKKQLKNYQLKKNTLDLVTVPKEQLSTPSKTEQNTRITKVRENKDNAINKYIINNVVNKLNFPLNLLVNSNSIKNIKNINYIKLISRYYPDLAVRKNIIYKFNFNNKFIIRNMYTLLHSAFISMHCLISQPRISYSNEKIIIQLFFYPDVKLSKQMKAKWSKNIINKLLIKLDFNSKVELSRIFKSSYLNSNQKIIKLFNKLNFNDQKEVVRYFSMPSKQITQIIDIIIKRNESFKLSDTQAQIRIKRLFSHAFKNYNKPIIYSEDIANLIKLQNNSMFLNIYNSKLRGLSQLLSKIFNKPVQLELNRLHYPFYDPNIIVNLLSYFTENSKIRKLLGKIYKSALIAKSTANINRKRFSVIPGSLSGLTLKFAGRFPTQKIVPRKTVKIEKIGSLARKKAVLIETARFTNKNRRGSFSISVSTGLYLNNFIK